ncbi:MAG: hypothetical protein RI544_05245 [Haloquadratum sp.]|jgi:uncharacterized membrane protein|nr:hypothetical protein [Haloferacaceae archaeon]MDR9445547.1 hypothetical protein [Haloquadratum sp.]
MTDRPPGDPRVLVLLDLVLSATFATVLLWGLELAGIAAFTLQTVAVATLVLAALTWVVINQ